MNSGLVIENPSAEDDSNSLATMSRIIPYGFIIPDSSKTISIDSLNRLTVSDGDFLYFLVGLVKRLTNGDVI